MTPDDRARYLETCRTWTLEEIERVIPPVSGSDSPLPELMRDYPLRQGKALRPALAIATCLALGGTREAILPTAAALELYHNAFLIHDDIEDGSLLRRGGPTMHATHGVPVAINVGDAMLAACLRPLLQNTALLGLGPALRILELVADMAWQSAEGQATELAWIARREWDLREEDYLGMVHKKTSWYTFITPIEAGGIVAGADAEVRDGLRAFASTLGAAFQIRDDVLNLTGGEEEVGKETAGDLWEGKRSLALLTAIARAGDRRAARARSILAKPRPELSGGHEPKTREEVDWLLGLVLETGGADYANSVAERLAEEATAHLDALGASLPRCVHRDFLMSLVGFVIQRDR